MTSVKEDRVLDDETGTVGTATIHVQDVLINQIKGGNTYVSDITACIKNIWGCTEILLPFVHIWDVLQRPRKQ